MVETRMATQPIETTSPPHTEPRGVEYKGGGTYLLWREDIRYTPPCRCRLEDLATMRFVDVSEGCVNSRVIEAGKGCEFWKILETGILDLGERGRYSFSPAEQ